ncbi:hypothetical protein ES708_03728 [subsurface metagenome]
MREFVYEEETGIIHWLGEFIRSIITEGYISPSDPGVIVIGQSRREGRPTQRGAGVGPQKFIRKAFIDCTELWNSLPEECPDPLPDPPPASKMSVWEAKIEHGVVCSYYDMWMRCCMKFAIAHGGEMPTNECFPCEIICTCEDIEIAYATQQMWVNEEQVLSAINFIDGCVYNWAIVSGGGTLSSATGTAVVYTAPSSNENCEQNPIISLSVKGTVCDTVAFAVNASPFWGAYRTVSGCYAGSPGGSYPDTCPEDYGCTDETYYQCDGTAQQTQIACFQEAWEPGGEIAACESEVAAGYCDEAGTYDTRSDYMKSVGCCPAGLL